MTPDANQTIIEKLCVQYNPLPWQLLCDMGDFNLGIRDQPLNPTQLYFASVFCHHFDQINVSENKVFELNSPSNSKQLVIFTIFLLIEKKLFKVLLLFLQNIYSLTENCLDNYLDNYIDGIFKIQYFLVFATGQSLNLTEVGTFFQTTVKKPKMERNINLPTADINRDEKNLIFKNEYFTISKSDEPQPQFIEEEVDETVRIKIYFATSTSNSEEKFDENKVLFYFADIQNNIADVFLKWCKDSQKIKSVINLYLGLFYIPKRYLTERFLNLAQALEAFHRIVYGGRYIDKIQYKNGIYTSLLNTIDEQSNQHNLSSEFKESLKQRLLYLYEFSLRKRLKELIKTHQTCFPEEFLTNKQLQKNFINAVVLDRNKLTHLNENTEIESIIEYRELYKLSNYMEALLRCCFMKFLAIDEEVIKRSIERVLRD